MRSKNKQCGEAVCNGGHAPNVIQVLPIVTYLLLYIYCKLAYFQSHKVYGILAWFWLRFASWHSVPRGRFENALKWGLLESHATNEAGLSIRSFDMQGAYRLDAWNLCVLGVLWWQILGVLRWQMRTAASKQQNSRFFSRGSGDR